MRSEVQVFPGPPLARPTILCAKVGAIQYGAVAQLGERLLCKQEVVGSIPSGSTNFVGFAVWFGRFGGITDLQLFSWVSRWLRTLVFAPQWGLVPLRVF